MPRVSESQRFDRTIAQLISKRAMYTKGLAEIDALFAKYGITINGNAPRPTRAAAPRSSASPTTTSAKQSRRGRRKFSQTADELVLSMVKAKPILPTAEINAAWKKNGRGGTADNTLGKLVKERKLKRTPIKDGRGSSYSLP